MKGKHVRDVTAQWLRYGLIGATGQSGVCGEASSPVPARRTASGSSPRKRASPDVGRMTSVHRSEPALGEAGLLPIEKAALAGQSLLCFKQSLESHLTIELGPIRETDV